MALPDANNCRPPVFFLTDCYTSTDLGAIKAELETMMEYDEGSKGYDWLFWSGQGEATIEQMWRMLHTCFSFCGQREGPTEIICTERQSFVDRTIIVAETWYVEYGCSKAYTQAMEMTLTVSFRLDTDEDDESGKLELKGMQYARCEGRDAYSAW